jgi:hypothetical protein
MGAKRVFASLMVVYGSGERTYSIGVDAPLRRSHVAALAEIEERDAELPGLVSEVIGNAGAGEDHKADWQTFEQLVVALERRRLGVPRPVRLEDNLRHVAGIGPAGGDLLGAAGIAAVQQHHIGMFRVHAAPPAKAIFDPFGSSTSASARRRACRKSRLSIIAAVSVRRLNRELQRGRHGWLAWTP